MRDDEKDLHRNTATTTTGTTTAEHHDANPDPLTGEAGAHPIGTGVGAASGGTVGAVIGGAVGGPLGAMVGAAVGGLAGGLAGKGISESVNPTEEDAFWRDHYSTRPYAAGSKYEDLQPAYRYGWEARTRHENRNWNDVETDLGREWNERHGSKMTWDNARNATQDAWNRVDARHQFNTQEDNYWRSNYSTRPYASGRTYEDLQPAYRYGYEQRNLNRDRDWNSAQNDLERGWDKAKANTRHGWNEVKDAVKDGWDRVTDPKDVDRSRSAGSNVSNTTGYAGTSFTGGTGNVGSTGAIGTTGAGATEGVTSTGTTLNNPAGSHLTGQGGTMTAGSIATGTAATGLAGGTPSTITGWSGTGSTSGTSNWQNEDSYWRKNYASRPYASGRSYDDLSPAYHYGYDSANQYRGRSWNEAENDLERGWDKAKGASRSTWHEVKDAVKDAWHRVERATPGDADRDGR
jgi:hypothetical protein